MKKLMGPRGELVCKACIALLLIAFPSQRLSPGSYTLTNVCHIDFLPIASVESSDDSLKHQPAPDAATLIMCDVPAYVAVALGIPSMTIGEVSHVFLPPDPYSAVMLRC